MTDEVDGTRLADALRAGIYRVFGEADYLNRINVFPVPDGDTGTNLAMTLAAVLTQMDAQPQTHAGALLVQAADAAIDGARGNSGAILAQFLHGLADSAGSGESLTTSRFADAFAAGARYAHDALTDPREGTLLSVLRDTGATLQRLAQREGRDGFGELFAAALPEVRASLEHTRGLLDEMRAADVVDAGAAGFSMLVEGMANYFATGQVGEIVRPQATHGEAMSVGGTEGDYRYCTECVVTGDAVDQRRLREELSSMGSSLVVAGTHRKARIHIHANEPARIFEAVARHGELSAQKADDMHRQSKSAHHSDRKRVAVVTDSAADLPDELLEKLDVHIVPVRVHFGERSYLDKVSLSPAEFYRKLAASPVAPKTSQPPPGDFRRMFEFLASHYEHVVCLDVSARVSGTWVAAKSAADRVPGERVSVIDSLNVSIGQGLLTLYAAERAQAGDAGPQVVAAVEAMRAETWTFGLLAGLDYAVRGGRVPPIVRTLSKLLRLSPILRSHADGRIAAGGAIFSGGDPVGRFANFIARKLPAREGYRIAVGHAEAEEPARRLLQALLERVPHVESSYLTTLGTALGAHGGPGMLVVGVQSVTSGRR